MRGTFGILIGVIIIAVGLAGLGEALMQMMTHADPNSSMKAAAGLGTALLALFDTPAFADSSTDIQILQTAASIEVLAVATYKTALTLPFIGGSSANGGVKAFATQTMSGSSSQCSSARKRPVRAIPVCTSSQMSSAPAPRHASAAAPR